MLITCDPVGCRRVSLALSPLESLYGNAHRHFAAIGIAWRPCHNRRSGCRGLLGRSTLRRDGRPAAHLHTASDEANQADGAADDDAGDAAAIAAF